MPGGELFSVVRTLLALLGVCALAVVTLRALASRGIGLGVGGPRRNGRVQVLERVALGARQRLYLVRADNRTLLIGAADGASLRLITELAPADASTADAAPLAPPPPLGSTEGS